MIDAHQHIWRITRPECQWPTSDLAAIYKDFDYGDYLLETSHLPLAGSVLVQSQEADADTDFLLGVAAHTPAVLGVVGWVDLSDASAAKRIQALCAAHPKLCGLRPMLQGITDTAWLLTMPRTEALSAMAEQELVFDALIQPRHLPVLVEFARKHKSLRIVIDHAAKPAIRDLQWEDWRRGMDALGQCDNVYCKISGLLTEAQIGQVGRAECFQPYVSAVWDSFGIDRCLWGSDWPVVNLVSSLEAWHRLSASLLEAYCSQRIGMDAARCADRLFDRTAREVYQLGQKMQ